MKILSKIKNKWKKFRYQPIRVYCFHHVSAVFDAKSMEVSDWTHIDAFKDYILKQIKNGITFISLKEAYYHISEDRFRRKRYSVLTFDDGYSSLLEILPWLKEMGLPFTLFINGKYLDGHSFRENPFERYLTFSDIQHIVQNYDSLMDIQSHGWEHNDASKMSKQEFEKSLVDNIRLLSGITNQPIVFHAYTWGNYTQESDEVLKKLGLIPVRIGGRLNYHDSSCVERNSVWKEI